MITEKRMPGTIREKGDAKFAATMVQLSEIRFANLVVDAETMHSLKINVCLLTNPHSSTRPVVLALRENTNFIIDDYAALFVELFSCLEQFPIVICSVIITIRSLDLMVLLESWISLSLCTGNASRIWST
jgi:hypothetical protein